MPHEEVIEEQIAIAIAAMHARGVRIQSGDFGVEAIGGYYVEDSYDRVCPLGAVLAYAHAPHHGTAIKSVASYLGVHEKWVDGFMCGVDCPEDHGVRLACYRGEEIRDFNDGFAVGLRARCYIDV